MHSAERDFPIGYMPNMLGHVTKLGKTPTVGP